MSGKRETGMLTREQIEAMRTSSDSILVKLLCSFVLDAKASDHNYPLQLKETVEVLTKLYYCDVFAEQLDEQCELINKHINAAIEEEASAIERVRRAAGES